MPNYTVHEDDSKRAWFTTNAATERDFFEAMEFAILASDSGGRHFVYHNSDDRRFVGYAYQGEWSWRKP